MSPILGRKASFLLLAVLLLVPLFFAQALAVVSNLDTTGFSLKLFRLAAKDSKENVVVSPFSVQSALSMALTGAQGQTRSEMLALLGSPNWTADAVLGASAKISKSFGSLSEKTQLQVANAIFSNKSVVLKKQFVDTNMAQFGAQTESVDFGNPATVTKINDWVSANTKGKISSIVDRLDSSIALCLINAVYFKSDWQDEFDAKKTMQMDFTLLDGKTTQSKLMYKFGGMRYLKGSKFQAVSLPYVDTRFQLFVFLPDEGSDFEAFKESFTTENWKRWMGGFKNQEGTLWLPRCKVEFKQDLVQLLSDAGMPCAFNGGCADFSGISNTKTHITKVLHKTYMDINEKGTEAAAVTYVESSKGLEFRPHPQPFLMQCDHPYVIVLHDSANDTILFMGTIVDPGKGN